MHTKANKIFRLIAIWVIILMAGASSASSQTDSAHTIVFICIPDMEQHWQPPNPRDNDLPNDVDIKSYIGKHSGVLLNTFNDLKSDRLFASLVLGQQKLFESLSTKRQKYQVQVRFVRPTYWFKDVQDSIAHAQGPIICQIGDTWDEYFKKHYKSQLIQDPIRFYWDVRLLWYRKDILADAEKQSRDKTDYDYSTLLKDKNTFIDTCDKVRKIGYVPFGISTTRDPNLLWNYSVLLGDAGGSLLSIDGHHCAMAEEASKNVTSFLVTLQNKGNLYTSECSNHQLTDEFLHGRCAMILMEPFVAWQAKKTLGSSWSKIIGATLPPDLGGGRSTFVGGTMLAIFHPLNNRNPNAEADAVDFADMISENKDGTPNKNQPLLPHFIPASNSVWNSADFKEFHDFFEHAMLPMCPPNKQPSSIDFDNLKRHFFLNKDKLSEFPEIIESPNVVNPLYEYWTNIRTIDPGTLNNNAIQTHNTVEMHHLDSYIEQSSSFIENALNPPMPWYCRLLNNLWFIVFICLVLFYVTILFIFWLFAPIWLVNFLLFIEEKKFDIEDWHKIFKPAIVMLRVLAESSRTREAWINKHLSCNPPDELPKLPKVLLYVWEEDLEYRVGIIPGRYGKVDPYSYNLEGP